MKILVIANVPIAADDLRRAVGGEAADDAEVLVIAPALHESPLRFWLSDADTAIAEADAVQRSSVGELSDDGITATGDTGESEPLTAITDTLRVFKADRVVIFSHPEDDESYREGVSAETVEERSGVPTTVHRLEA